MTVVTCPQCFGASRLDVGWNCSSCDGGGVIELDERNDPSGARRRSLVEDVYGGDDGLYRANVRRVRTDLAKDDYED